VGHPATEKSSLETLGVNGHFCGVTPGVSYICQLLAAAGGFGLSGNSLFRLRVVHGSKVSSPGINDAMSGTAGLMELANGLQSTGLIPNYRSLLVIDWAIQSAYILRITMLGDTLFFSNLLGLLE
jgi:hypothetical protein